MEPHSQSLATSAFRAARVTILLSFVAAAILSALLIGERLIFETTYRNASDTVRRAQSLSNIIILADERLTMSANMAASTGNQHWVDRYNSSIPVIDAAIKDVMTLAPPEDAARFNRDTKISNDRLVEIERAAFAAVDLHRLNAAQKILHSRDYTNYKTKLAAGTRAFLDNLIRDRQLQVDGTRRRGQWTLAILIIVGLFGFVFLWRASGRRLIASCDWHRRAEARLHFMAHNDELTRLPNRKSFEENLESLLRDRSTTSMVAVAMLDIDNFKDVNDLLGHPCGDELLRSLAARLQAELPEGSILARFGGDEFAIVLPTNSEDAAGSYFSGLNKVCATPFDLNGHHITSSISIGVAFWPSHAATPTELLRLADISLYEGKATGRNRTFLFDPKLEEERLERQQMEVQLREALKRENLMVHYQPIFAAAGQDIVGLEALLRWPHPTRGDVSPKDFIPVAEQSGLILPIGEWVMRRVFEDSRRWPELEVAINISPLQLRDPSFYGTVRRLLSETHAKANQIYLEITEGFLLQNDVRTQNLLSGLHDLGFHISIDDYGTGYSSLGYLMSFPFDKMKIDQSFVQGIETSTQTADIVRSVIALGKTLGLAIVAEGVETQGQHDFLAAAGCHQMQGFLLGKPLPSRKIQALLSEELKRSRRAA